MKFNKVHAAVVAALSSATGLYSGTASAQLEEIIVTAEFREANVQETPIAITAVNAAMLESRGQTNIVDVANQAPNVTMTPAGQSAGSAMVTFIRGVGQSDFNYALEPGVGMYVDEVYYPNLTGSMVELLDIDRVEIARGPQGTLSGRNSIGGSVKIYSVEPTHGGNTGTAELTLGNYEQVGLKGSADLTFVEDVLSARISGVSSSRNGYVTRVDYKCTHPTWAGPTFNNGRLDDCKLGGLGGESFTGGRFSLLWTPSDTFRVKVLADLINQDNESAPHVLTRVTDARHTAKRGDAGRSYHGSIQPGERPFRGHVPRRRRQHGHDSRSRLSHESVRDAWPVRRRSGRERPVHHVRNVPRFDAETADAPLLAADDGPGRRVRRPGTLRATRLGPHRQPVAEVGLGDARVPRHIRVRHGRLAIP